MPDGLVDEAKEIWLAQLHRRNVDRHPERRQALCLEALQGEQGGLYDPAAESDDQPGLLGDRDEAVGWDQFAVLAPPAQQRFDTDNAAAGEIDLRLVGEEELFLAEGEAQVAQEMRAFARAPPHLLGVDDRLADAARLRLLQREEAVLHVFDRRTRRAAKAYQTGANGHDVVDLLDGKRRDEALLEGFGGNEVVRPEQGKGVTGQPCDEDGWRKGVAQPPGGESQQRLDVIVAENVVRG